MRHLTTDIKLILSVFLLGFVGCISSNDDMPGYKEGFPVVDTPRPPGFSPNKNTYSLGLVGEASDVETETKFGLVVMGGGADVDAAFRWMIDRSGGGDFVVIRASGTDAYNKYINGLGTLNSVETLLIDSRAAANDDRVVETIENAEALFIAGGDQSDYMNFWRGTKTQDAINYLMNEKKVPVGGTSAGAAILGRLYYSGENGSITSDAALANPYNTRMTLYANDFLATPYLNNLIADQHFSQRNREGRLVAFLSRYMKDNQLAATGIGVDERTAVCISDEGKAVVYGSNAAYFLKTNSSKQPETVEANQNLQWKQNEEAVAVYRIAGGDQGNGEFDVNTFENSDATGGTAQWWWVENGQLKTKNR